MLLSRASSAFGWLQQRLWNDRVIQLPTKISIYRAAVMSSLLYGCKLWTTYQRHIRCLDQFYLRCLRQILGIKWQDRIPNTEVLQRCQLEEINAHVLYSGLATWSAWMTTDFQKRCSTGSSSPGSVLQAVQ